MTTRRVTPAGRLRRVWFAALWIGLTLTTASAQVDYKVGIDDVLAITVFNQPTLTGKYTVETDGTFSFPLLGRVPAGGLTHRAIEENLTKLLRDGSFLKQPQVSVAVEQYRSQRIYVYGEVRQPGEFTLSRQTTIMEAVLRAGSPTADASGEVVVLRRAADTEAPAGPVLPDRGGPAAEVFRADLEKLRTGQVNVSFSLRDGDTLFLPRGEKVFVTGHVRAPGAYPMQKSLTVLQALSLAGGATERAATNRIRVARIVKDERKEVEVKLADQVSAGDTIIVPERYF